jgi:hypothetical protein
MKPLLSALKDVIDELPINKGPDYSGAIITIKLPEPGYERILMGLRAGLRDSGTKRVRLLHLNSEVHISPSTEGCQTISI